MPGSCPTPPTPPAPNAPASDTDGNYNVTVTNSLGSYGYTVWNTGQTTNVSGTTSTLAVTNKPTGSYGYNVKICYIQDNTCSAWGPSDTIYVLRTPDVPAIDENISPDACATSLTVSWVPGSGYPGGSTKQYVLEESANGGAWTSAPGFPSNYTSASWSRTSTTELATYKYRVKSRYQWNGFNSQYTDWDEMVAAFTMPMCPPAQPAAPTLSQPNPDTGATVSLSWTAPSVTLGSILGYRVQWRNATLNTGWTTFTGGDCAGSDTVCVDDAAHTRGQTYEYRVQAYRHSSNTTGDSPWSAAASITILFAQPSAISAPTFSGVAPYGYTVNWSGGNNANTGTINYDLWEKIGTANGSWTDKDDATSQDFTNRTVATAYEYKVRACNGNATPQCAESTVSTISFPGTPGAITIDNISNNGRNFRLNWGAATGVVSNYELMQSTDGGQNWSAVSDGDVQPLTETFVNATPGANYQYKVRACNSLACGVYGAVQEYWVPEVPGDLSANADPMVPSLTVSWTANALAEHYELEQSTDNINWQMAAETTAPSLIINSGLSNGTTYYFRVTSCNTLDECSGYGGPLEAYLPYAAPDATSGVSHQASENNPATGAFTVHWNAPAAISSAMAPVTHYRVDYSVNGGSTWQAAPTGGAVPGRIDVTNPAPNSAASATLSGLATGAAYSVRVRACNADACSANTPSYQIYLPRPAPGAPTLIPTVPDSADHAARRFTVQWNAPATGTVHHYQLEAYAGLISGNENWLLVVETPALAYTFTDRAYGETYRYRVRACSEPQSTSDNCSAWTATENIRLKYPTPKTPGGIVIGELDHVTGNYSLSWNGVLGWATAYRYELEENANSTGWQNVTTALTDPVHEYAITGRAAGSYAYRVRACNPAPDNDCGGWSPSATATVLPTPTAPASLSVDDLDGVSCRFDLDWTPSSGGQGTYQYELAAQINNSGSWNTLAWTPGTSHNFIVHQNDSGDPHVFRVRARTLSNGQYSPWGAWRTSGSFTTSCAYGHDYNPDHLHISAPKFSKTGQYIVTMQYSGSWAPGLEYRYHVSTNNGASWGGFENWATPPNTASIHYGSSSGAPAARTSNRYIYRVAVCDHDIGTGFDPDPIQCPTEVNGPWDELTVHTTVVRDPGNVGPLQIAGLPNAIDGAYITGNGQITLDWSAAPNAPGPATHKYQIEYKTHDASADAWLLWAEQTSVDLQVDLAEFGVPYDFRVRGCAYMDEYVNCGNWAQLAYPVKQSMPAPRFAANSYPADGELVIYDERIPLQWLPPWDMAENGIHHYEISIRSIYTDSNGVEHAIGPEVLSTPAPITGPNSNPPVQQATVEVEQGGLKEFLIRACGTTSPASCGQALEFQITVVVPPDPPAEPTGLAGQAHPDFGDDGTFNGALSGQFSAQPSGAAGYVLPIIVPPGTAGVQPKISLTYNSQAGNGIAGLGWSISGLTVIARCNKTLAQDGATHAIDYTNNDAYCLDGQRLIEIGTNSYRTEKNDFSRITKQSGGVCGTWFEVKNQSGETLQYGNTADACIDVQRNSPSNSAQNVTHGWALNRATDVIGNYVAYKYIKDVALGANAFTVKRIEYTGRVNGAPYTAIDFQYDNERPDPISGFHAGVGTFQKLRLTRITTGVDPNYSMTASNPPGYGVYTLNYEEDRDRISRLTSIDYCANADTVEQCMEPLEFEWSPWQPTWESLAGYTPPEAFFDTFPIERDLGARMADMDNDGLPDLLYSNPDYQRAYRNTGTGWQLKLDWTPPVGFVDDEGKDLGVQLADITGDDVPELLTSIGLTEQCNESQPPYNQTICKPDSFKVYKLSASGWVADSQLTLPASFMRYWTLPIGYPHPPAQVNYTAKPGSDNGLRLTDLNADGLLDLVLGSPNGDRKSWRNTGSSNPRWAEWAAYNPPAALAAERALVTDWPTTNSSGLDFEDESYDTTGWIADFNGDSLPDLMYKLVPQERISGNREYIHYKVRLNTGTQWSSTVNHEFSHLLDFGADGPDGGIRLVDLNGDGLIDLMRVNNGHDLVLYNTGNGFWNNTPFTKTPEFQDGSADIVVSRFGRQLLDLNYDGRTDVLLGNNAPAWLSTETADNNDGWQELTDYILPMYMDWGFSNGAARIVDINGDGRTDILGRVDASSLSGAWTQSSGKRFITGVKDGLDNTLEIKYKALTDKRLGGRSHPLYTQTNNTLAKPLERQANIPLQVVSQVTSNDGIGGELTTEYAYEGLTAVITGRGLQGFDSVTSYHPDGTVVSTRYAKRFPYTGLPLETTVNYGEGANAKLLERTANEYCYSVTSAATAGSAANPETASFTSASGTCGEYDDQVRNNESLFVFVKQTTAVNKRLNDNLMSTAATVTTVTDSTFGVFGHLTQSQSTVTGDGHTYVTETSHLYSNGQSNWHWLGRIQESTVTRRIDGVTDANSTLQTAYEYHPSTALLWKEKIHPGVGAPLELHAVHAYDQYGNIAEITVCDTNFGACVADPNSPNAGSPGRSNTTIYDGQGRYPQTKINALDQIETYQNLHPLGLQTALTGPNGLETSWTYDPLGRKKAAITLLGTTNFDYLKAKDSGYVPGAKYIVQTSPSTNAPIRMYYDGLERKRRTLTQNLHGEWVAADTEYDHLRRVLRESQPYFVYGTTAGDAHWTINHYDSLGRLTQVDVPVGDIDSDGADDGLAVNTSEYQGFVTISIDAKGRRKLTQQNALGQTVRAVDDEGNLNIEVDYTYDSQGNLKTTTVDNNPATTVTVAHDRRGNKTLMTDPDTGQLQYQYNGYGEIVRQQDAKGQIIENDYDKLGRVVQRREWPDENNDGTLGSVQTSYFVFDTAIGAGIGKLHSETGAHGDTKTYSYTDRGQLAETLYQLNVNGWSQNFVTSQFYDEFGRIEQIYYPQVGGERLVVENHYSPFGGLWYVLDASDPSDKSVYWIAEMVDAHGKLLQETLRNQNTIHSDTNTATGWLQKVESWDSDLNMIQQARYGFDKVGNIQFRERFRPWIVNLDGSFQAGESEQVIEDFAYDSLDRLLSASVTRDGVLESTKSHNYDRLGNFLYKDSAANQYTYNACNAGLHAVCSARGSAFSYDDNGNMIASTGAKARSIEYNAFNKPTQITENGASVEFVYGASGSRVFKQSLANGQTQITWYVGLGADGQPLYEQNAIISGGQIVKREHLHFVYADAYHGGQPFAVRVLEEDEDNNSSLPNFIGYSGTEYYHRDHLGSVIAITGDLGSVQETRLLSFDAWGKRRNENWSEGGSDPTDQYTPEGMRGNLAYTGHESVPEVGLIHMNGRVYDPELGVFLSADLFIQSPDKPQSYNRYSYVQNNPLRYTDPSGYLTFKEFLGDMGEFFQTDVGKIFAIVLAIVGGIEAYQAATTAVMEASIESSMMCLLPTAPEVVLAGTVASGMASGAILGAAGGLAQTGTFSGMFHGAMSGAALGGINALLSGMIKASYLDTWDWTRVGWTALAGGASAELSGEDFEEGLIESLRTALLSYAAYEMRQSVLADSSQNQMNSQGKSVGYCTWFTFVCDHSKGAGGRAIETKMNINGVEVTVITYGKDRSILGGHQGLKGRFLWWDYDEDDWEDHLLEAFGGPHDTLNSWYWYTDSGNIDGSKVGTFWGTVFGDWILNYTVNVALATPFVAARAAEPFSSYYHTYKGLDY